MPTQKSTRKVCSTARRFSFWSIASLLGRSIRTMSQRPERTNSFHQSNRKPLKHPEKLENKPNTPDQAKPPDPKRGLFPSKNRQPASRNSGLPVWWSCRPLWTWLGSSRLSGVAAGGNVFFFCCFGHCWKSGAKGRFEVVLGSGKVYGCFGVKTMMLPLSASQSLSIEFAFFTHMEPDQKAQSQTKRSKRP